MKKTLSLLPSKNKSLKTKQKCENKICICNESILLFENLTYLCHFGIKTVFMPKVSFINTFFFFLRAIIKLIFQESKTESWKESNQSVKKHIRVPMSMKMKTWANKLELLAPKQEEQYYLSVQEWLKQDYLTMATASMSGHVHCLPLIDDDDKTTGDECGNSRSSTNHK